MLKLGSDPAAAEVSIAYTAGATLADVASAINAKLKGGTPNYSSADYGGYGDCGGQFRRDGFEHV